MKKEPQESSFLIVPLEKISIEARRGLIDEFILREGTDYGAREFTLEEKHQHIEIQIQRGQVAVVFDTALQSVSLVRRESLPGNVN